MDEKQLRKEVEDCILGKKDLVQRVEGINMDVCTYRPADNTTGKRFCRYIEYVFSCTGGSYYPCGKNLVPCEPKA